MKISIIIPAYNRAHLLGRAIQSILAQQYEDWEIIVVDDGSHDNIDEVMKKFGSQKIKYIKLKSNVGVSAARNRGVVASSGEWVSFLDSDDAYLPNALSIISTEAEKVDGKVGMLFFPIEMYTENDIYLGKRGYVPSGKWTYYKPSYEDLLIKKDVRNDMHRCYRSSVIKQFLFDERIKDHDTLHYANVAKQGVSCLYVNKSLVKVYTGRGDHLSHGKRDPRAWYYIYSLYFKDHNEALRKYPLVYVSFCIGMASCCFKLSKIETIFWIIKGFFYNPLVFVTVIFRKK